MAGFDGVSLMGKGVWLARGGGFGWKKFDVGAEWNGGAQEIFDKGKGNTQVLGSRPPPKKH